MWQDHLPKNRLLTLLPTQDRHALLERGQRIQLPVKTLLCEPDQRLTHVYFPDDCVLSSIIAMKDGAPTEAAAIGVEGMLGVTLLADATISPYQIITQVSGTSLRVPANDFLQVYRDSHSLRHQMQSYTLVLLQQTAYSGACNLRHSLDQRMCRWLLSTMTRAGRSEFDLTQEFLSIMLGVRRQSVNQVAGQLQQQGLIRYRRGRLEILDREGVRSVACDCHAKSEAIYERIMGARIG